MMNINTNGHVQPITLEDVAPEIRDIIGKVPRPPVNSGLGRWVIRAAGKFLMREKQFAGIRIEKHKTKAGSGLRVYVPEQQTSSGSQHSSGALLWIHGGGFVIGDAKQDDRFCADAARDLNIVVISAEYRLAPESPFPAGLDDCFAAWAWVQESAQALGIDPQRVAIGGQSAGGGLAANLVQRIHDGGGVQPAAQWLFSPMLDDRTATKHELDAVKHFVWDNRQNRTGWSAYLGDEFGKDTVSAYSVGARREDVRGLPPTWLGVGDIDLFFDEDKAYAERLSASGVACTVEIVEGAPHGFESIAPDTQFVQDYLGRARAWLAQTFVSG